MYGTTPEDGRHSLFSIDCGEKEYIFSREHAEQIIDKLLTRKQRNNGLGRALKHEFRHNPSFTHLFGGRISRRGLGFTCSKLPFERNACTIALLGDDPTALLRRLNRENSLRRAIVLTERERILRRQLRVQGVYKERAKAPKAVAGQNGNLVRHFQNTRLTLGEAIEAIAYASGSDRTRVKAALRDSLKDRDEMTLRITQGFVFRVKSVELKLFPDHLDLEASVTLWSTKDNRHQAYRRLRKKLKVLLKCESKARRRANEIRREELQFVRKLRSSFRNPQYDSLMYA